MAKRVKRGKETGGGGSEKQRGASYGERANGWGTCTATRGGCDGPTALRALARTAAASAVAATTSRLRSARTLAVLMVAE